MSVQFLEAVFAESTKYPNFFNGRILTATDLRDEQAAGARRSRALGQAVGEGVVYGLYVTRASGGDALEITSGLAVSRSGDVLNLPGTTTTVELLISEALPPANDSPFVQCTPGGSTTLTGIIETGFYLIAICPSARPSTETAPHSGLNGGGAAACINRYEEFGVQFKLIQLSSTDLGGSIAPTADARRSQLAAACFGLGTLEGFATDPLGMPARYGLADTLRSGSTPRLSDCDVPLAVFQFRNGTVDFVDVWAVRRPCLQAHHPDLFLSDFTSLLPEVFTSLVSPRRAIEAAAFLLQFQNQLEDIRTDTAISPNSISAATYFTYLPAAGYLPIRKTGTSTRRFTVPSFFGRTIEPIDLDPAFLRKLFHDSLYTEPIEVGTTEVDVYRVVGSSVDEPYLIFARHLPLVVAPSAPEEPEEDEDIGTPPVAATGDLYVVVLSESGTAIPDSSIRGVQATSLTTSVVYDGHPRNLSSILSSPYLLARFERWLDGARDYAIATYGEPISRERGTPTLYVFPDLPVGNYSVTATPSSSTYYAVSQRAEVRQEADNYGAVYFRRHRTSEPRGPELVAEQPIPMDWGVLVEGIYLDLRWCEIWPDGCREIVDFDLDPGNIDPPPDDWKPLDDFTLPVQIEEVFGINPVDPGLIMGGAEVYIRNGFNPTEPSTGVDGFVQTKDGSRFPIVVVAVDNSLDQSVAVTRTEIPDYDAGTFLQLNALGLGNLVAAANAPIGLMAAALGQSEGYAASLNQATRTSLSQDFQQGFMSLPGVTKDMSDALKEEFGDKVGLANASAEEIAGVLAGVAGGEAASWAGYSDRLQDNVRSIVPESSFDLGAAGISEDAQAGLGAIGVETAGDYVEMAGTQDGLTALAEAMDVPQATAERYADNALAGMVAGEIMTAPVKSIGTLEGMTEEVAAGMVAAGIYTAVELANSDSEIVAAETGFAKAEIDELAGTAREHSFGYSTIINRASGGAVTSDAVGSAGYLSVGGIAGAETAELENIPGMTSEIAGRMMNVSVKVMENVHNSGGAGGAGGVFHGNYGGMP